MHLSDPHPHRHAGTMRTCPRKRNKPIANDTRIRQYLTHMRSLIFLILCLAGPLTAPAAEIPNKFAGRWAGIAEFGQSKNPNLNRERALLTFEVNADGSITNGAVRDFAGYGLVFFGGQLDSNGRLTAAVAGGPGPDVPELKINLGQTTGTGTYRTRVYDMWNFRSEIRFWREEKPARGNGENVSGSVSGVVSQTMIPGYTNTAQHYTPPSPPAPSAP